MSASKFRALLLAGLVSFFPVLAAAKSYTIPDPNPVAVITMPDDWETTVIPKGIEADSEDEEVYIAIEATDWKDAAQVITESIVWLKGKGVEIDKATEERKSFTHNGMEGTEVRWDGKDEDGPTKVSLTLLRLSETKGLVLTYWASPDGEKANLKALMDIASSLKPVK